jgi:ligand-binding sensor domain-containing protein/signal transduction histidine kinase
LQAERLPIQVYTAADGLAQVTVHTIHRDREGFLWFGTSEGLSFYDGYEFVTYRDRRRANQPRIRAVLDATDGTIWAGGRDGLCRVTALDDAGKPYECTAPAAGADIQVLFEERPGVILAGTDRGLYRIQTPSSPLQFTPVPLTAQSYQPNVRAIIASRSGDLWIGTMSGIYRLSGDRGIPQLTAREGLPSEKVLSLTFTRDGRLWAGTEQGVCRIRLEGTRAVVERAFTEKDGLPGDNAITVHKGLGEQLWVGTASGLAEALTGAGGEITGFRGYSVEHGLSDTDVTSIEEDIAGNLWMGTQRGGAMKLTRGGFTTYGVADGLGAPYVMGMLETRGGEICAMTRHSGQFHLNFLEGQRFRSVPVPVEASYYSSLWTGWYQVAAESREGAWWIGSERGLLVFPPGWLNTPRPPAQIYGSRNGLPSDHIYQVFQDSRGGIWVATRYEAAGLSRWDPDTRRFHQFTAADGIPAFRNEPGLETARPNGFGEDGHGQIWIGWWNTSVLRYAKGRFQFFGVNDGVPAGGIRRIYMDRKGRVWLGSGRGGVARIDNPTAEQPTFRTYSPIDGLSAAEIQSITEDREGRIYLGHGLGVDRIEPDAPGPLHVRRFTTNDGLAGGEQQTAIRDRNGVLWFGSVQGVSRLAPAPDPQRPPLEVFITSVRVNGRSHPLPGGAARTVQLPPLHARVDQLQIEYAAPRFVAGDVIRYQYRLSESQTWSAATTLRSLQLAELNSGPQRFEVRATNGDGLESRSNAVLVFEVIPPIWRRWWFLLSCAAAAAAFGWIWHTIALRRQLEMQAVRMRIARDLHDEVGTGLSQIAILSEVAQRSADGRPLAQIAEISRELVDSISDIVWAINPARDNLPDLAQRMRRFASDLFTARNVELAFEAGGLGEAEGIGPETRRQIFLIYRECLRNAVRHSQCQRVKIRVARENGSLMVQVADDGVGFDRRAATGGTGLASLEERARAMGGRIEWLNGTGTTVTLRVPLPM